MKDRISTMVDRFLGWKLPKTFGPDCGISFKPSNGMTREEAYEKVGWWPIGTNLLTATEAREMLEHVLDVTLPVDEAQERADFEAAMRPLHPEWAFTADPVFDYHNERTRCAWEGWKAARGVAPSEAPGWVRLKDSDWVNIVNHPEVLGHGSDSDLAVACAVRLTEARLRELNTHGVLGMDGGLQK